VVRDYDGDDDDNIIGWG